MYLTPSKLPILSYSVPLARCGKRFLAFEFDHIAFLRKMRYDVTDLNEVKNIEPENVLQL